MMKAAIVSFIIALFVGTQALLAGEEPAKPADAGPATTFDFTLDNPAALTSAGIFDAAGRLVKQVWAMKPLPAGKQTGEWDGLDEFGKPAPAGEYEFRVVASNATYRNVAVIGNTGTDELQHIQHNVAQVALDAKGRVYTANGWEEGGQDFKVMDTDGKTLFHARYQMRNGNPNGAPYSITTDENYIYCGMQGWAGDQWKSRSQIQRFKIEADPANPKSQPGTLEKFTDPALEQYAGHVQLYEFPEKLVPPGTPEDDAAPMRFPIRALAIGGDTIFACDALGGKIVKYHKVTGTKQGEFPVKLPQALAIDSRGRLWVGHEHTKVTAFDADGKSLGTRLTDVGDIKSLAFGPNDQLCVADGKARQVKIYNVSGDKPKLVRTFGRPAKPGDYAPDRFYTLNGAAMNQKGELVTIVGIPTGGARIAKFAPNGKCLWEQLALVFCDLGKYSTRKPNEFITHRFHRILLTDKNAGTWEYRGTILDSPWPVEWQHGVLNLAKLGKNEFFLQCYGDGLQAYRRSGDLFKLVAMVGGVNPRPDGLYNDRVPNEQKQQLGQWTWTDQNGNNKPDDNEVAWFKKPGEGRYAVFGMNTDDQGNILYCCHHTRSTWELPMAGLDKNGNPTWDWSKAKEIIPADKDSPVKFQPLMAIRAEDGSIYSFGRSGNGDKPEEGGWARPGGKTAGYAWMGGWALMKYDNAGQLLWAAKLPRVCVGMDIIPGNKGVMLGHFEKGEIYHYTPDGLLIGQCQVGDAAGKTSGWMDNTSAVAVQRDPKDGILDVFGEDSWLNRLIWYRVDDKDVKTISGKIKR